MRATTNNDTNPPARTPAPVVDLASQSWIHQPSAKDLRAAIDRAAGWAIAGWITAAVFAGLFLWLAVAVR